jgi:uncharacterized protein YwqG
LGGWGCTVAGLFLLASSVLAFRVPLVGVPLVIVAGLIAWRIMARETVVSDAVDSRRRELGPPVGDIWRRLFEQEGLGDVVEDLSRHVRSAVRLSTTRVDDMPLGGSRIGGTPDLAPGMTWPRREGVPLAFLAQINLREVEQVLGESPLPRSGQLWFFFEVEGWPSGSKPSDAGGAVVLFDDGTAGLEPTVPPADLPKRAVFPACSVTMEPYEDIPSLTNERWLDERLEDGHRDETYDDIAAYLTSGWSTDPHKLLGYANPVQDVMELGCELVTNGITFAERRKEAERVKELEPRARDWRLLLQVESDGNAGMMWGDAGCLYFWIREEDLRAARFDRTWLMFQCH